MSSKLHIFQRERNKLIWDSLNCLLSDQPESEKELLKNLENSFLEKEKKRNRN